MKNTKMKNTKMKMDLNQQLTNDLFNEMDTPTICGWLDYYVDVDNSIWDWERLWMNSYGEMDYDELIDEYYDGNPPTLKQLIESVISNVDGGLWEYDWYDEMKNNNPNLTDDDLNVMWDKMVCEINTRLLDLN
jgi:hypothetical protein